jgi:hypothetical protein
VHLLAKKALNLLKMHGKTTIKIRAVKVFNYQLHLKVETFFEYEAVLLLTTVQDDCCLPACLPASSKDRPAECVVSY